jgi:hypothetical protein
LIADHREGEAMGAMTECDGSDAGCSAQPFSVSEELGMVMAEPDAKFDDRLA